MTLLIILEALYDKDDASLVEMINNSVPVKTYSFKNKLFVIHSGFRFMINAGKAFDLLIDLSDLNYPQLILSPVSELTSFPLILGLVVFKKNKYIDAFSKVMIAGISEDNVKIYPIESKVEDIEIMNLNHSEFYIFRAEDNSIIRRFPLSRLYNKSLLLRDGKFYEY